MLIANVDECTVAGRREPLPSLRQLGDAPKRLLKQRANSSFARFPQSRLPSDSKDTNTPHAVAPISLLSVINRNSRSPLILIDWQSKLSFEAAQNTRVYLFLVTASHFHLNRVLRFHDYFGPTKTRGCRLAGNLFSLAPAITCFAALCNRHLLSRVIWDLAHCSLHNRSQTLNRRFSRTSCAKSGAAGQADRASKN